MAMHHIHIMMNHGIAMLTEGSNLVMLAGMKMTPPLDTPTLKHGQMMIASGKEVIQRSLSGPEMTEMMQGDHGKDPLMDYTHRLGEATLKVAHILSKMDLEHMSSPDTMTMHHMHITLNHALQMAAEGSSLIMIGQMGMAKGVDRFSIEHGREMISNARSLVRETMDGRVMKELHAGGVTRTKSMRMQTTHELAEAILKVIDLLEKMSPPEAG